MARSVLLLSFLKELYDQETSSWRRKAQCVRNLDLAVADDDYIRHYRLNKDLIRILQEELCLPVRSRSGRGLKKRTKILCTLSFLASGSYQRVVGSNIHNYVSQPSMSRSLHDVVNALCDPNIVKKYIQFPQNYAERAELKKRFYEEFEIPDCIGCIDCTFVAMIRPKEDEEEYYCFNRYYAKNIELIVDADLNIMHVDVSHGGAIQDCDIFNSSTIKSHLEELTSSNESVFVLGDSGFFQRRYLMTPVPDAINGTPEAYYNDVHSTAYSSIESTIATLKGRFRCLLVNRVLHYDPSMVGKLVIACCVLHNMCNRAGIPVPQLSDQDTSREAELQSSQHSVLEKYSIELEIGTAARTELINTLWSRLC